MAFLAASDGLVRENLAENFLQEVHLPEASAFYSLQIFMENIHYETYSLLIDTYIQNSVERSCLTLHNVGVVRKAEGASNFVREKILPFAQRLLGYTCVEMVFICVASAVIFWLKGKVNLPGLASSSGLITGSKHARRVCLLIIENWKRENHQKLLLRRFVTLWETKKVFGQTHFLTTCCNGMQVYTELVANKLLGMLTLPKVSFDQINNITLGMTVYAFTQ